MLMPKDIVEDVETVLRNARCGKGTRRNFLTAYQILDRLRAPLRDTLIRERGVGGKYNRVNGRKVSYGAPGVVARAAAMSPRIVIEYMDSVGLTVEIAGQRRTPSGEVTGLYRLD